MADNLNSLTGGTVATTELVNSGQPAHVQHMKLRGAGANEQIEGTAANGLEVDVTRVQGTVAVSHGGLTDTQLRATPLPVEQADRVSAITVTSFPAGTGSVSLLSSLSTRRLCAIYNNGTTAMRVKRGTGASLTSWSFKILPGGYWEMPRPIYTGAITAVWEAAAGGAEPTGEAKIDEA